MSMARIISDCVQNVSLVPSPLHQPPCVALGEYHFQTAPSS